MLHPSLEFLRTQLNAYLRNVDSLNLSPTSEVAVLGDISRVESGDGSGADTENMGSKVVMTLIRIEEETTLSNQRHFTSANSGVQFHNPPLHLNVYLMVSANFDAYSTSLMVIDEVLQFFLANKVFRAANFPSMPESVPQFFVDLYDPGFEQLSYIWSPLGGKAFPSVLYKLRLLTYLDAPQRVGPAIDAIGINENSL